jgi:hypothetical protein
MISRKSNLRIALVLFVAAIVTIVFSVPRGHIEPNLFVYICYFILFVYITSFKQIEDDHVYSIYCLIRILKYDLTETIEISLPEESRGPGYWYIAKSNNGKKCLFGRTNTNLGNMFKYIAQHSKYQVALDASALARTRQEQINQTQKHDTSD